MRCRFCDTELIDELADLGFSPPSNSFLDSAELLKPEINYPLKIMICSKCYLVQIDEFACHEDIFNKDYIYFSSYSKSWLSHCKNYSNVITTRLNLDTSSFVVEVASNDGYLLQYFKEKNIPVLGIEPTNSTAQVAISKGIETKIEFFGVDCAKRLNSNYKKADLIIGNNVLAHVPNLNDFVAGLKILLAQDGVISLEFPHLLQMIDKNQFDTIYHEHFSYFSLITLARIFLHHGLQIFDVDEIPTHGGSLRIYVKHKGSSQFEVLSSVEDLITKERNFGLDHMSKMMQFQNSINKVKNDFLSFLIEQKNKNKVVVGYGAAAKGNTLLNYCGIRSDLIKFIADASPHKQNKYIPGMHIPVVNEDKIRSENPDYVVILPWNLKDEISEQLSYIRQWNAQFVVAVPNTQIF